MLETNYNKLFETVEHEVNFLTEWNLYACKKEIKRLIKLFNKTKMWISIFQGVEAVEKLTTLSISIIFGYVAKLDVFNMSFSEKHVTWWTRLVFEIFAKNLRYRQTEFRVRLCASVVERMR